MKVVEVKQPGGLDNLIVSDRPDPTAASGEIVVRWHATSLNYHDYLVAVGAIPVDEGRVPMSDGAGEIVSIGEGVTDWNVGDKVMSLFFQDWIDGPPVYNTLKKINGESVDGFICEQSVVPAYSVTKLPEGYSFAEAATLPCAAATAWRGLVEEGELSAGQNVLIEGTGGMSIFGLQIAKSLGAKVYATTSSNEKTERLNGMGVEAVVNYKEDERWGRSIFKMSGSGMDHVLDVGGGSTMENSIDATAIGGHISSIGILSGGRKGQITFPKLFFKHIKLQGIAVGNKAMQLRMIDSINEHGWRPIIDKSFAFDQLAEAFKYQESGKHFGKIVLEW